MTENQQELRKIMEINNLKNMNVAEILSVSIDTVKSWLSQDDSDRYRPISDRNLEFLRLKLQNSA
jgi:hypothetical protein